MLNQKRTIMGACDYSIETLKTVKKDLMYADGKSKEIVWGIGGVLCSMTANLLQISNDVFTSSAKEKNADIKNDILEIQSRFNNFVNQMVNNE